MTPDNPPQVGQTAREQSELERLREKLLEIDNRMGIVHGKSSGMIDRLRGAMPEAVSNQTDAKPGGGITNALHVQADDIAKTVESVINVLTEMESHV
jgi:hypothetical protein